MCHRQDFCETTHRLAEFTRGRWLSIGKSRCHSARDQRFQKGASLGRKGKIHSKPSQRKIYALFGISLSAYPLLHLNDKDTGWRKISGFLWRKDLLHWPDIPINLITLGYQSKFDHRPTDSGGHLAFAVYISLAPLSLKSLIICKQLIKMGIWERICKGHWETCKALREQTKLPLDPTLRINDCEGRARWCGSCKGSVWSASHLICINTSGLSESHKTVIMYGQIWPSLPAFSLRTHTHTHQSIFTGESRDAGLKGEIGHLRRMEPQQWGKKNSQNDHHHFHNQQPDFQAICHSSCVSRYTEWLLMMTWYRETVLQLYQSTNWPPVSVSCITVMKNMWSKKKKA